MNVEQLIEKWSNKTKIDKNLLETYNKIKTSFINPAECFDEQGKRIDIDNNLQNEINQMDKNVIFTLLFNELNINDKNEKIAIIKVLDGYCPDNNILN